MLESRSPGVPTGENLEAQRDDQTQRVLRDDLNRVVLARNRHHQAQGRNQDHEAHADGQNPTVHTGGQGHLEGHQNRRPLEDVQNRIVHAEGRGVHEESQNHHPLEGILVHVRGQGHLKVQGGTQSQQVHEGGRRNLQILEENLHLEVRVGDRNQPVQLVDDLLPAARFADAQGLVVQGGEGGVHVGGQNPGVQ